MYCPSCGTPNDDNQEACSSCGAPLGPAPASGQGSAQGYQQQPYGGQQPYPAAPQQTYVGYGQPYAGFWKRFVAYIIDGILANIVVTILGYILGVGYMTRLGAVAAGRSTAYSLLSLVIVWLYFALMESSSVQATVGKMALGIKVTDLDGHRISFGKASVRHWSKILSTIILLIGYIMAGFTARKQALHDIIAGTLVVNKH